MSSTCMQNENYLGYSIDLLRQMSTDLHVRFSVMLRKKLFNARIWCPANCRSQICLHRRGNRGIPSFISSFLCNALEYGSLNIRGSLLQHRHVAWWSHTSFHLLTWLRNCSTTIFMSFFLSLRFHLLPRHYLPVLACVSTWITLPITADNEQVRDLRVQSPTISDHA